MTIGAIYRFPNTNIASFSDNLRNLIINNNLNKNHIILGGDFNIDLGQQNCSQVDYFLNSMNSCMLIPTITKPTRVTQTSATTLDHIWTNITAPLVSGIIYDRTTDHYPTFLIANMDITPPKSKKLSFRLHSESALDNLTEALHNINWDSEFNNTHDINSLANLFLSKTLSLYNLHCPLLTKQVTDKRLNNPWLTSGILNSINKKHEYEKKVRIGLVSKEVAKRYSSMLTSIIRKAKLAYYVNRFNEAKGNMKSMWGSGWA